MRILLLKMMLGITYDAKGLKEAGVDIRLEGTNNNIYLSVRDSGAGVSKEEKTKIFERFYRGDTSRNNSGNGLGLSLVKAIVELHHGAVSIENLTPGLAVTVRLQPYQ